MWCKGLESDLGAMSKSSRVRLSDIRRVYRILSEVVELGHDPQLWRPHLAKELSSNS